MGGSNPALDGGINRIWSFADAEYNEARRELRVGGMTQTVEPRPLAVLQELLSRGGEVATRQELLEAVWQSLVVDQSLTTAVGKLRAAFGTQGRTVIEAVHGIGYRIGVSIELRAGPERPRLAFTLRAGNPVPNRPQWCLDRAFGSGQDRDVWLARHVKTGEPRVFKLADTEQRLDALKREAALSRILHDALGDRPDLVRVVEWNFEFRPYFLESPYGGPDLVSWAAARGGLDTLPLADRVGMVVGIARTVAAAHGVGVLHRDIKPTNILVDEFNQASKGRPALRLVDFGSGRLTEAARAEAVTVSGLGLTAGAAAEGGRISGTLGYMAPEILAGGPPTIAGDVYALGILLYQMIVGDFDRPLVAGWENDVTDPLLREDVGAAASGDAARRLPAAAVLADRLNSLDVRRTEHRRLLCLEAQTERLAAKLERTRTRRPWLVLAGASLALGFLTTSVSAIQALRQRNEAELQSATVGALNQFLSDDLIAAADPNVSGKSDLTVAAAIRQAAARIDVTLGTKRPEIRAALHAAMETAFTSLTDYDRALVEGDQALAALRMEGHPDWAGLADIQLRTADALIYLGRLHDAGIRLTSAEEALARVHPARTDLLTLFLAEKGFLAGDSMDLPNFLHNMQAAWKLAESTPGTSPRLRDQILMSLGDAFEMTGNYREGEAAFRRVLQSESTEYGYDDARPSFVSVVLANVESREGRPEEALAMVKKALPNLERELGPFARRTVVAKDVMAGMYFRQCKFDAAARLWADVVAGYERAGTPAEVHHMGAQSNLALAWMRSGQDEAAEQLLRVLLEEQRGKIDPDSPQAQAVRFNLAYVLLDLGKPKEVPALRHNLSATILNMNEREPDWPGRLAFIDGRLALEQGNRAAALALLTEAQPLLKTESADGQIKQNILARLLREASVGNTGP